MIRIPHDRAEVLAGAIALGEATDEERLEYRRHVADCGTCLQSFGGEHELERVSNRVKEARNSEVWDPDVRAPLMDRLNTAPRRFARYGLGFLGVCLIISLIGHFVAGSSLAQIILKPTLADPLVINYEGNKVVLERRSVRDEKTPTPAPPKLIVEHNVVHLARPVSSGASARVVAAAAKAAKPVTNYRELAMTASTQDAQTQAASSNVAGTGNSNVPSWRSAIKPAQHGAPLASAAVGTARAESITIAATYSTREAEPEGGETAINPQPSMIAYAEGAEGTTAFEVLVDEQGNPAKCVVTKASGYPVLDEAVCRAAMKVHYRPKTLNGHPVPGVYRDAFTFRQPDSQN